MGQNISQMAVMGSKRAVINGSAVIDTTDLIAVTIDNSLLIPTYQPDVTVDEELVGFINMALLTGATAVNMKGLQGKTTYLVSIDNLIPEVFNFLISKKDKVWVDGLGKFNLLCEVDDTLENADYYNKDFSKSVYKMTGINWDNIADMTGTFYWGKYVPTFLEGYETTAEDVDNMLVEELNALISNIEKAKQIDLVTTGLLKQGKVDLIKETLGLNTEEV